MLLNVVSDLGIVGYNPEMADIANPRGAIYRNHYWVQATLDDGNRFDHYFINLDKTKVEALLARMSAALDAGDGLNFAASDLWADGTPVYGSEAYQAINCEGSLD